MKVPDKVAVLSEYEDDDGFESNPDALEKIMRGYVRQLTLSVGCNRRAAVHRNDELVARKALWNNAVVTTLEDVLSVFLHDSPARGEGPHEADELEFRNCPL